VSIYSSRAFGAVAALAIDKVGPRPYHFRSGPTSGPTTRQGSNISKISVVVLLSWKVILSVYKKAWRNSKRATAVRVWRPLAKKSIKSTMCDVMLMVNTNRSRITYTICEIFSGEVENRHFCPLCCDCSPLAEERPAISM